MRFSKIKPRKPTVLARKESAAVLGVLADRLESNVRKAEAEDPGHPGLVSMRRTVQSYRETADWIWPR